MSDPEFIKKGVVEQETEEQPVKTASDEIFEKVKACSPTCHCKCKASQQEAHNEQSK